MVTRIGSLCSGYGGLEMGVQAVSGGTVAWHVEYNADASRILAHHWPDVPNHGDLTTVEWTPRCEECDEPTQLDRNGIPTYVCHRCARMWPLSYFPDTVEPVDVITAGYPCQPFSHAGKRKGTKDVRHLWPYVAAAVRALRPRLVFLENVAGHVSLGLDVVLGDLSALGYDARWGCLRAAAVGAPHGRERVFIAAVDTDPARIGRGAAGRLDGLRAEGLVPVTPADAKGLGRDEGRSEPARLVRGPDAAQRGPAADTDSEGLGGLAGSPTGRYALRANLGGDAHGRGDDAPADAFGAGLEGPRPCGPGAPRPRPLGGCDDACALGWDWGLYTAAVHRWHDLTRCVPAPVQPSTRGGRDQLAPRFVEWMQGLPAGHVTDPAIWHGMKPSTARNAQLTALGNGVVPHQAAAAYALLIPDLITATEAVSA